MAAAGGKSKRREESSSQSTSSGANDEVKRPKTEPDTLSQGVMSPQESHLPAGTTAMEVAQADEAAQAQPGSADAVDVVGTGTGAQAVQQTGSEAAAEQPTGAAYWAQLASMGPSAAPEQVCLPAQHSPACLASKQ